MLHPVLFRASQVLYSAQQTTSGGLMYDSSVPGGRTILTGIDIVGTVGEAVGHGVGVYVQGVYIYRWTVGPNDDFTPPWRGWFTIPSGGTLGTGFITVTQPFYISAWGIIEPNSGYGNIS